jgi:selenocysteine lyase/cysteine desulfurase
LYVRQSRQDEIEPVEFGWTNVATYNDYSSRDMTLRPDAGRYECGTLNTIGCYGLRAALDLILEVGIPVISSRVQALADQVWLGVQDLGYETLGRPGAGIVSVRKPGVEAHLTVRRLKDARIIAAPRQGWVRISPHFYIEPADIDKLLSEL